MSPKMSRIEKINKIIKKEKNIKTLEI